MAKESSLTLRVCDWLAKYSIFAALFLVPIFFLPWTSEVLDFNKQALLLAFVAISFFSWMLKALISGKLEINVNKMHIVVGVFFLVYLLATVFSVYKYGSFWGWPQITSESLLSISAIILFYFLATNIFSKKDVFTSVVVLFASAILVELISIFQLFGWFILPFDFTKSVIFNTIGTTGSLGFLAAILLPIAMLLLMVSKKWWKILFASQLILSAMILFLINYNIIWWVVIIGSALVMVFGVLKKELFDSRWMALPMFFLAISLFFMLLSPQVSWLPQRVNEIFLSQKSSLQISFQAIREKPIFGSGPGTFAYNFSKFKDPEFNKSSLWSTTFNRAVSKVLNDLATTGVLGFLALIALMAYPLYAGVKFLIDKKTSKDIGKTAENSVLSWTLILGLLIAFTAQTITYFLYNSNIVLEMLYFFLMAGLVVLTSEEKIKYELKSSSLATLLITFAFTLTFIFGLGLVILDGQRYAAEINYFNGISAWQTGAEEAGVKKLEVAASGNSSSDLYFRQLSQVYLLQLQNELSASNENPSDEQKAKIQTLVANSVNAGKIATDINPNNANNWSVRGYVYQTLYGVGQQDADSWATNAYDEALKLDPYNPYILTQEGNIKFVSSTRLGNDKQDQKNQLLTQAKEKLQKAVNLNPNYSNALYSLGLVYNALGENDNAVQAFTALSQLNPDNKDITKILNNVKAGKPAFETETPPAETPPAGSRRGRQEFPSIWPYRQVSACRYSYFRI